MDPEHTSQRFLECALQRSDVGSSFAPMSAKRATRFIRDNPLFPFIPFGPIALFLGSVVMSAMALRGVRQVRRELAAIAA
jgi:hypothetical protein